MVICQTDSSHLAHCRPNCVDTVSPLGYHTTRRHFPTCRGDREEGFLFSLSLLTGLMDQQHNVLTITQQLSASRSLSIGNDVFH